jgi:hypothetical protein
MSKGYILIEEPTKLELLFGNRLYFDMAVIIFQWLISELYTELGNQLKGVEVEVIKIVHHSPHNKYPGIGVHIKDRDCLSPEDVKALIKLIETTIDRLLEEKSVQNLVTFVAAEGVDWKEFTNKIMTDE